jgi:hypothetical protein
MGEEQHVYVMHNAEPTCCPKISLTPIRAYVYVYTNVLARYAERRRGNRQDVLVLVLV